jgi:subfamily B ATP-binding cassette protein MsbA
MKKFNRIFKYIGYYKGKILLYMSLTIVASSLSVISVAMLAPLMSIIFNTKGSEAARQSIESGKAGKLVSQFITHAIQQHGQMYAVAMCCGLIIFATFLKNLFLYLSSYISVPVRSSIIIRLRNDMFAKVLTLPIGYFSEQRKGDIMSRMTNDVNEIESSIVSTMEGLIKDPVMVLSYLVTMIYISPTLSLFLLILLPATAFIIGRISRTLKKQSSDSSLRVGETLSILDETLGGIRVIKAFSAELLIKTRFESLNNTLFNISKKISVRRDLASPLTELLGVIVLCVILYFGGNLVLHGNALNGGDLIAYIAIFSLMINPAKTLSTSFFNVQRGAAAIERIEELLQAPVVIEDSGTKQLENFNGQIEFRNVNFSYTGKPVLTNINLVIPKGKTVALVGSSGAGKSTLADLLPRFHDVTNGEILIDGVNIKEYRLSSVRKHISIVTQEPILFNETVAGNIALGKTDATEKDIEQAAKVANVYNFIQAKKDKFNTNIGDRGNKLSGGEKQRVTIARALLKNPPILILDEATSSLDTESERLVQEAINNMMINRTSLVIAHRLSTVRFADEIIVLDKGRIAERGPHEQLMQIKNGIYRKLVMMQEVK